MPGEIKLKYGSAIQYSTINHGEKYKVEVMRLNNDAAGNECTRLSNTYATHKSIYNDLITIKAHVFSPRQVEGRVDLIKCYCMDSRLKVIKRRTDLHGLKPVLIGYLRTN